MMDATIEQQLFTHALEQASELRDQNQVNVLTYCLILLAAQADAGEIEHYSLDLTFDYQQMMLPRAARAFLRNVIRGEV